MRVEQDMRNFDDVPVRQTSPDVEPSTFSSVARGEALLRAMSEGNHLAVGALVTFDVRLTSFDRGEIHESQGREAVTDQLLLIAERAEGPVLPTGFREHEDAVFFWGGSSKTERPGWMITLFLRNNRFFDVRVFLLR